MRAVIVAVVCGLALAATPLQAAPVPTKPLPGELGVAPPVELVRDGCGRGWHRTRWHDQWGFWHWGDCVPDGGGPYRGNGAGTYYPPSYWGGPPPDHGVGNPLARDMCAEPALAEDPERLTLRQADQVPTRTRL
jgi:hypothetical protein